MTDNEIKIVISLVSYGLGLGSKMVWDWSMKRRDETRDRCKEIEALVIKFERTGSRYWSCHAGAPEAMDLATEIKFLSKQLGFEVSALSEHGYGCVGSKCDLKRLRQAVTDGNFESRTREPEFIRIDRIQHASVTFVGTLRKALKVI